VREVDTTVQDLVGMIDRGELRPPAIQLRLVWTGDHVRELSDSFSRGSPGWFDPRVRSRQGATLAGPLSYAEREPARGGADTVGRSADAGGRNAGGKTSPGRLRQLAAMNAYWKKPKVALRTSTRS